MNKIGKGRVLESATDVNEVFKTSCGKVGGQFAILEHVAYRYRLRHVPF